LSVKIFLIGYTRVGSEDEMQVTDSPDNPYLAHVIATAIPYRVVEMFTPIDNTMVIPAREGIELSLLNKRTVGKSAAHRKTTNSNFIESFSLQRKDKTGLRSKELWISRTVRFMVLFFSAIRIY
jgi:hypothetical protein